jgi:hypothetical protein
MQRIMNGKVADATGTTGPLLSPGVSSSFVELASSFSVARILNLRGITA